MNLPNKITVFRFCCVPLLMAFAYIEFSYHWVATLLVYFVACMSDKADGIIARKQGIVTDFGKLMDPLSDKTLVFAAFIILIKMGWH
ncbi:MAG: CDP-alcohol phosphatidyltransferase family protein, partial [Eubacterium sp.]